MALATRATWASKDSDARVSAASVARKSGTARVNITWYCVGLANAHAIGLARGVQRIHRTESVGGGIERGVELLEPVDEDRVDQSVLAPEVRVDARRRAAGGGGDVADRQRARTFALHDPDRGPQDGGALIGG